MTAVTVAKAVHCLTGGSLTETEDLLQFRVTAFCFAEVKKGHESSEVVLASGSGEVLLQSGHGKVEQAQHPLTVKDLLRGRSRSGGIQHGFGGPGIEGDQMPAPALFARGVTVVIGDAALEHAQKQGAQATGPGARFLK